MGPTKPLRSQPARDRILAAARDIFGRDGYERATIRAIAVAASINPSMVMRYFGSKEQLFAQVATLDFQAERLAALSGHQIGEGLVRHVLNRWEDPATGPAMAAMFRASLTHEPARVRLGSLFGGEVVRLFTSLGVAQTSPEAPALIATQILGLGLARYVLKLPAVVALPEELVVSSVGRVVQNYIDEALRK